MYQGTQTYPILKHIGRYQPESKATKVRYPIAEKLNSVLIDPLRDFDCKIYDVPTRGSLNKKIEPSRRNNSHGISDMWRYSWNYLSEEDAIFKKEFEQAKKTEIKKISTQIVKDKKNGDEIEDPDIQLAVKLMTRCGKGTRRNKVTGNCDPVGTRRTPSPTLTSIPVKLPRCPNGTRRNKVTKNVNKKVLNTLTLVPDDPPSHPCTENPRSNLRFESDKPRRDPKHEIVHDE